MCDNETPEGSAQVSADRGPHISEDAAATAAFTMPDGFHIDVVERDVEVQTADGTCDAVLIYPAGQQKNAAVLIWTDVVGLRTVFREMGRRLAAQGYVKVARQICTGR